MRADAARASLGPNGGCIIVDDLDTAVSVANEFAAENLQVVIAELELDEVLDALTADHQAKLLQSELARLKMQVRAGGVAVSTPRQPGAARRKAARQDVSCISSRLRP